ncbi:MAG: VWA domain-containing protein [Proteobacteria bacterium]|nr:VWA domain-containing protein [Pseudomonadota bacterium]
MFRNQLPGRATAGVRGLRAGFARQVGHFRADEQGSLIVLGLFCFVIMLLVSGFALDIMRDEERRTVLTNTNDRAMLAAANLHNGAVTDSDVKAIVKDYYVKSGLKAPLDSQITVQQGTFNEWRTVQATTNEQVPTWFMNMVGVKTLPAVANGAAEERVGQVEISLVLDVSGSMTQNSKLVNLKPAAKSFIDQMFDTVEAGKLSISIVPYSTQVSLGPDFMGYFGNTAEQNKSSCLEFNAADFSNVTLQPKSTAYGAPAGGADRIYQRNGHFDPFYTTNDPEGSGLWNCPPDSSANQNANNNRWMMVYGSDRTTLKAKIDNLVASGNTSIDLGMKWGAGLLDPSMSSVVDSLIARGKAPASFADRPYAYSNKDVLKVIVLMTDGENTTEYKLRSPYGSAAAPTTTLKLYRNTTTATLSGVKRYSLYDPNHSGSNKYYSFNNATWQSTPWASGGSAVVMAWPEVWQAMSINYFADNIISPLYGTTERNKWRTSSSSAYANTYVDSTTMDTYTQNLCNAAKANNVKIFTIGFEASTAGQNLLKACATSPAHFYSVAGLDIKKAFSSIAASISKLRLTH